MPPTTMASSSAPGPAQRAERAERRIEPRRAGRTGPGASDRSGTTMPDAAAATGSTPPPMATPIAAADQRQARSSIQTIAPIWPGRMPSASSMPNSRVRSSTLIRRVLRMMKATTTTRRDVEQHRGGVLQVDGVAHGRLQSPPSRAPRRRRAGRAPRSAGSASLTAPSDGPPSAMVLAAPSMPKVSCARASGISRIERSSSGMPL